MNNTLIRTLSVLNQNMSQQVGVTFGDLNEHSRDLRDSGNRDKYILVVRAGSSRPVSEVKCKYYKQHYVIPYINTLLFRSGRKRR